jgi:hypothetical protein
MVAKIVAYIHFFNLAIFVLEFDKNVFKEPVKMFLTLLVSDGVDSS